MTMPAQPSPAQVANVAQQITRNAEGRDALLFRKVALVNLGVMALASVSQVLLDVFRKKSRCYDRDEASRRGR
jgi:hypothetical protein